MGKFTSGRRAAAKRATLALGLAVVGACTAGGGSSGNGSGGSGGGSGGGGSGGGGLWEESSDGGPGSSNLGSGGGVLGVLELDAPARSSFVLRGTLPVPKGTYPRSDGMLPLALRNWDGQVVPTQLEVVSRYPNEADGADVVEILGYVDLPPGVTAGARVQYHVVEDLLEPGKLPIRTDVLQLLTKPGSVQVVATDGLGHKYTLDLFEDVRSRYAQGQLDLRRKGAAAVSFVTYDTLRSAEAVGAPSGALQHLFGVHAYATAWAWTDALSLDLRFNNGSSGHDKTDPADDPLGLQYFKTIELRVPSGWSVVQDVVDPQSGQPFSSGNQRVYPLVKPLSAGLMHVMPSQASFHRRLALVPSGEEGTGASLVQQEGLGFARRGNSPDSQAPLYSWWCEETGRFFPQRHALPDLSYLGSANLESKVQFEYQNAKQALETGNKGTFPIESTALGWAHPWGVGYGGMTGGLEIHLYDGLKTAELGTIESYRAVELCHRMNVERQPTVLFNKDGRPTRVDDWVVQGPSFPYVDMFFFQVLMPNGGDPFGFNQAPQFQVQWVRDHDLDAPYEAALLGFYPIDFQHYVRFTRSAKVLAWLGNDELAKDDLRMAAEIFRLSYHEYANNAYGTAIQSGLKAQMAAVQANPDVGMGFGRGEAWGVDCALAAYSLSDPAWRATWRPWFNKISDTLAKGQSACNGFIQSVVNDKWLNGQYKARQSIEQAITEHVLLGMVESVFRGVDSARKAQTEQVLRDSLEAMIGPMAWSTEYKAPWSHLAVAPLQNGLQPYCGSVPPGGAGNGPDAFQTWSSFAYGFELTGKQEFLQKALEMAGGSNLLIALKAQGFGNLENQAALIAVCQ
jgi:hypothetical protein